MAWVAVKLPQVLDWELEEISCGKAAQSGYGKTCRDVMNMVERYVNSQNPSRLVSISNGWWYNFKKRNPFLSSRSEDSAAGIQMSAVNEENINHCFDLLQEIFDKHNHPEAVYNMDETGMPLEPCPPKFIAAEGQDTRLLDKNNKLQ